MEKWRRQAFSCANSRFHTDTATRFSHAPHTTMGSVLPAPLIVNSDGESLWLEHVVDMKYGSRTLWFMWYDKQGSPKLDMSGVFDVANLSEMTASLAAFLKAN